MTMTKAAADTIRMEDRRICCRCIPEAFLSDLIAKEGQRKQCHYCGKTRRTISIDELSRHVVGAMHRHFVATAREAQGYDYLRMRAGMWERAGEPVALVIANILESDEDIGEDIRRVLDERTSDFEGIKLGEEQPFDSEIQYAHLARIEHWELSEDYEVFEQLVIEEARYFSPTSRDILARLFDGLDQLQTEGGTHVLVEAGPGLPISSFFRARVFQDEVSLRAALCRPDQELAPPPPRRGRAGRLNASGVSVFYGASEPEVALAEVRPPVHSRVLMARFDLVRPVQLLDIDALEKLLVSGSYFDPDYSARLQRAGFLGSFAARFARPIMPNHEAFEYIPTQAIADYLAHELSTPLDGILYRSAQAGGTGKNVALFQRASGVAPIEVPEGLTREAGSYVDEEDGETYTVFEELPPPRENATAEPQCGISFSPEALDFARNLDSRKATLALDPASLCVHRIDAVKVKSTVAKVSIQRSVKGEDPF